jgi:perosamine synthetase
VPNQLALFGGPKVRTQPFGSHPIIGEEEKRAVMEVLESGHLSTFIAAPGQFFYGGERIRQFEREFADYHGVQYAIAFNSATAALHAAVVAVGVHAGEEVIVPPFTFTSTATSALMHNAIPVFADIEPNTCSLDAASVEANISPLSRAMIPVHLFGHPADMDAIMAVARKHNLKVIEDCAQAPGARYNGRLAGTIGDCGIFSFTENKNITTGEGGMLITNDAAIAQAASMVRNHGEMILADQKERTYNSSILGWNYRMTEMEAALGIVQFRKMEKLNAQRAALAEHVASGMRKLPGLNPLPVQSGCTHAYYALGFTFDENGAGLSRADFAKAVAAEGVPLGVGYVRPLYLTSIYHENKPSAFRLYKGNARYDKGICPVAERMHERDLLLIGVIRPPCTTADMDDILNAMSKVIEHKHEFEQATAAAR